MTKLVLCCTKDLAIDSFAQPFCVPALGAATRGFSDEANRKGSEINTHPEDYELYELGLFDTSGAHFELLEVPRRVCRAVDVLNPLQ